MQLRIESSEQKLRGAYYTPQPLAQKMIELSGLKTSDSVLEPSCGDGIFLDCLNEMNLLDSCSNITAIEVDSVEAQKVHGKYGNRSNCQIVTADFFDMYGRLLSDNKRYDIILGNPPYIRYQYLSEEQRTALSRIIADHGMKSNKLINVWVAFLVSCVELLTDRGTIAFVVPAEILQVAYAEELRKYLSDNLASITIVTLNQLIFPDIDQEIVVLIGQKGTIRQGIRIIEADGLDDIQNIELDKHEYEQIVHTEEKWTRYFITGTDQEFMSTIQNDPRFVRFADQGTINVGITTGNNKYFSVTEDICSEFGLMDITLPLIGRSSHAHGIYFHEGDWEKKQG